LAATLADIARKTGTSIGSVAAALNNNPGTAKVSEKTKRRIVRAATKLNYRPSYLAQSLKTGKTNAIGYVVGEISTPIYGELSNGLIMEAEKLGYSISIHVTKWRLPNTEAVLDKLMDGRCDGIILQSNTEAISQDFCRRIEQSGISCVVLNHAVENMSSVKEGWYPGMQEFASLICDGANKRLVFLGDNVAQLDRDKLCALDNICKKNAIPLEWVECEHSPDEVTKYARKIAQNRSALPNVVLVESDILALVLIKGLKDVGIDVPGDIEVVGFNDILLNSYISPALTTIGFDKKLYTSKTVELLVNMLKSGDRQPKHIKIPTYLVRRDTTK
jgi:LacI family transcriptional regulator, galactose operon repressor